MAKKDNIGMQIGTSIGIILCWGIALGSSYMYVRNEGNGKWVWGILVATFLMSLIRSEGVWRWAVINAITPTIAFIIVSIAGTFTDPLMNGLTLYILPFYILPSFLLTGLYTFPGAYLGILTKVLIPQKRGYKYN